MNREEALQVLTHHQKWRKGADIEQTDVRKITEAIDVAIESLTTKEEENDGWITAEEFDYIDLERIEVKFDNGSTCMYMDHWPNAEATHFRMSPSNK